MVLAFLLRDVMISLPREEACNQARISSAEI